MACPNHVPSEVIIGDQSVLVCRECGGQFASAPEPAPEPPAKSPRKPKK